MRDWIRRRLPTEDTLKAHPGLREAYRKWDGLSKERRLQALQELAELFAQVYGTAKLRVEGHDFPKEQDGVLAFHRQDGALLVNASALEERDAAMETVVHQGVHRYQDELIAKVNSGQLGPDDDRYGLVQVMAASRGAAQGGGGYAEFRFRPEEAQAFLMESAATLALAELRRGAAGPKDLARDALLLLKTGAVRDRLVLGVLLSLSCVFLLAMAVVVIRRESATVSRTAWKDPEAGG